MRKAFLLTLMLGLISSLAFSQTDRFWSANNENPSTITTDKAVARLTYPKAFKLFNLNIEPLKQELFSIVGNKPSKFSAVPLSNSWTHIPGSEKCLKMSRFM